VGLPREETIGRYELLIELARGGMAELFLGRLHGAGGFAKLVAIKRILPHLAQDPQFKDLFLNEGRIAAQLSHPNVCQVFELEEHDGELFLAMEYLDGVSWDHLVAALPRGPHALWLTAGVIGQAAEGLHYAHTLRDIDGTPTPVIHRDVSPQNLFVTVDGVCKVLDFGVAKIMTDGPRTRTGVIKGKLPYMAPEQIQGDAIDGRADVFSLGVCAWEALAGTRLFDRQTDFQIWKAITEEPIPPITSHWPECPTAVESVVQRALARNRDYRHASAREFADALRAAAGGTASLSEIAQAVRECCGDRIVDRQRQVATAVSSRRIDRLRTASGSAARSGEAGPCDRDAATTIPDGQGDTVSLRQQSAKVVRPAPAAADEDASETRDLKRDSAATRDQITARPRRGKLVVVALLAAAAAATIAVIVVKSSSPASPEQAAQQPAPAAEPEPAAAVESADEPPAADPVPQGADIVAPTIDAGVVAKNKPRGKPSSASSVEATPDDDAVVPAGSIDEIQRGAEDLRKGAAEMRKAAKQLEQLKGLGKLGGAAAGDGSDASDVE
jgi:eukaryotic-like serine/threonine-protein kinase